MKLKSIFMKCSNAVLSLLLCMTLLIVPSIDAYAYDEASSYVNEEGDWEVDMADGPEALVTMYMMVQPDYSGTSGFRTRYWFWCNEGEFNYIDGRHETSTGMNFFFRAENADVVEIWDGNEIWFWSFRIEPGKYSFSEPEGLNHISVLTQSFGSPFVRDGYTEAEVTVVEAGDTIRLYCMFGEWEWRKQEEQLLSLQAYAEKREEELNYGKLPQTTEDTSVTIEVEGEEIEPTVQEVVVEEPVEIATPEPLVELEESKEPVSDDTSLFDNIGSIIKVVFVLIFVVGVFLIPRKGKDDNE